MASTVLVVEDDHHVVEILRLYLGRDGHKVLSAGNGIDGLRLAREASPGLVVLDLMLPGIDGMKVCRALREESDVPIVMLTARVEESHRLEGLDLGADDYVTKPFNPRELAARVRAVLRRTAKDMIEDGPMELSHGEITVNVSTRTVNIGNNQIALTPTEFRMLALFMKEPGRTFTRDQIIQQVFGYDFDGFDRTIDAHISNLRKRLSAANGKVSPTYIRTVYGVGYKFGLQFRLILGFTLTLGLALTGVGVYTGFAADREVGQFSERLETARAARIEEMISESYRQRRGWDELQGIVERAGALYDRRIVVTDAKEQVIADSHARYGPSLSVWQRSKGDRPIRTGDEEIGFLALATSQVQETVAEPAISRVVSSLNWSLVWTGLAAGVGGVLLVTMLSRRILAPVRELTAAAASLGRGNLHKRVSVSSSDEIGQLGSTFNAMADRLQKGEEQRVTLIGDVAHELRTPLSNIQGYLEAIRDGLLVPNGSTIDIIHQQALHLGRVVEDLRIIALADAGALALSMEVESVAELLEGSVEAYRPLAEAKGVTVTHSVAEDIPMVLVDRTRIAQVLTNLLNTAVMHTPKGGSVLVSAEASESVVKVSVTDTGEGMPSEELEQIFRPILPSRPI